MSKLKVRNMSLPKTVILWMFWLLFSLHLSLKFERCLPTYLSIQLRQSH